MVRASKWPSDYDATDLGFLPLVANQVAVTIENALAFQEIEGSRSKSPRRTWPAANPC